MKTKGKRQSDNVEKAGPRNNFRSRMEQIKYMITDPKNDVHGSAVIPKDISDGMEKALKDTRLTNSKRNMDRTVNARPDKPARVDVNTEMGFDKDGRSTGWKQTVDADNMKKINRKIQVTPGKWITK